MNKHNDGGPAFPRPISTDYIESACNIAYDQVGMTLRQYYKAHAPKEIPNWFWPDVDCEVPPLPGLDQINDEGDRQDARSWMLDANWDLRDTHPQLEWFEDACIAHWNAINERDRLKIIERVRQWPGHWADLMLDEDHDRGK